MQTVNKLKSSYQEVENRFLEIVEFLEANKDRAEYKGFYKGIITLKSPLIFKPKILFLGINEGQGGYIVLNQKNTAGNETPLKMIGKEESCLNELNWFELGNARGGKDKRKNEWVKYNWYERDKPINNSFVKTAIDLLYYTGDLLFQDNLSMHTANSNSLPFWFDSFGKQIMVANLYPIATENTDHLTKVLKALAKEKSLQSFWKMQFPDKTVMNDWLVKVFFIRRINELIALVQPEVIVCIGYSGHTDPPFRSY